MQDVRFIQNACQYYVTARFAMEAQCMLVCGTLFHHAVEMALKAGLAKTRKLSDLKDMGHDLKKLWRAYKADFPDPKLKRHDQTISRLDKFETLRYPDTIKKGSIGITAVWSGPPGSVTTRGMPTPKQFQLVVDV